MAGKTRRQRIEDLLREDPNDSFLWYGLAMEQAGAGEHEAALWTLDELRRRDPDYVPAYLQAGQLLARLDREEEARAVFQIGIAVARRKGDLHAAGEMEGFLDGLG
jgi:predicted Zn-dependent protease